MNDDLREMLKESFVAYFKALIRPPSKQKKRKCWEFEPIRFRIRVRRVIADITRTVRRLKL